MKNLKGLAAGVALIVSGGVTYFVTVENPTDTKKITTITEAGRDTTYLKDTVITDGVDISFLKDAEFDTARVDTHVVGQDTSIVIQRVAKFGQAKFKGGGVFK